MATRGSASNPSRLLHRNSRTTILLQWLPSVDEYVVFASGTTTGAPQQVRRNPPSASARDRAAGRSQSRWSTALCSADLPQPIERRIYRQ